MKWIIFCGLLFFHLSAAQIDGTCEECIDFIQASSQLFASNEVVDITETFLKQNVCPQMSDVKGTLSHYSKSQIFVQKFNFDKTPTFSRVIHPNFFDNFSREIKVVNS